jgi:hypothetical protein
MLDPFQVNKEVVLAAWLPGLGILATYFFSHTGNIATFITTFAGCSVNWIVLGFSPGQFTVPEIMIGIKQSVQPIGCVVNTISTSYFTHFFAPL